MNKFLTKFNFSNNILFNKNNTNNILNIFNYKYNFTKGVFDIQQNWHRNPQKQESKKRERMRQAKREKHINKCSPDYTDERPIPGWNSKKGKSLYNFTTDYLNSNRFSRKLMTADEKKAYIQKNKDYSLYCMNLHRKEVLYKNQALEVMEECTKSYDLLPDHLKYEVRDNFFENFLANEEEPKEFLDKDEEDTDKDDVSNILSSDKKDNNNSEESNNANEDEEAENKKKEEDKNQEDIELSFTDEFLYYEQRVRLMTVETAQMENILLNAYKSDDDEFNDVDNKFHIKP